MPHDEPNEVSYFLHAILHLVMFLRRKARLNLQLCVGSLVDLEAEIDVFQTLFLRQERMVRTLGSKDFDHRTRLNLDA